MLRLKTTIAAGYGGKTFDDKTATLAYGVARGVMQMEEEGARNTCDSIDVASKGVNTIINPYNNIYAPTLDSLELMQISKDIMERNIQHEHKK